MKTGKAEFICSYIRNKITYAEIIEIDINSIRYKVVAVFNNFNNIENLEEIISKKIKGLVFYKINQYIIDDYGEDGPYRLHRTIGKKLTDNFEAIVILDENELCIENDFEEEMEIYSILNLDE